VPLDGGISASLGGGDLFVVEADEYDSAFFDKRSKFVHYHSDTLLINNIEFDHADIFADLAAIQRQFHHLVRTVPGSGTIIYPNADGAIETVLAAGCWSDRVTFGDADGDWQYRLLARDGSSFKVLRNCAGELIEYGRVSWRLTGRHNVSNAMGAIIAARGVGVALAESCGILSAFAGVKRRMEVLYQNRGFTLYDDFAHHPTAIATTLEGLRVKVGDATIVAVIEPRSATMRQGIHGDALAQSLAHADYVVWYRSVDMTWDIEAIMAGSTMVWEIFDNIDAMAQRCVDLANPDSHMVMMSNGGFEGLAQKLLSRLDR
jgi:UDP-N-acetylmuramate: L-alanyl-gamma-D-glutamyl-meso-diaminopimelate ligase